VAPVKRGLKRGLKGRLRTVLLMLDETIVTETPPWYAAYGHVGEQVRVPITGNRGKRVLHGALNIRSGAVALLSTDGWDQQTHQAFLSLVRAQWRGWNIVLFEDRASQHQAPASVAWAQGLGIEVRLLPRATPELNAMDHLWRHAKRQTQGNRPPQPIEESAMDACRYILNLSPRDRLRKAGVLSGNFWLLT
jgi:DDE superfamily endonuclease